jgi:hypothetical protein
MSKDLHSFLKEYEAAYPEDVLHSEKEINLEEFFPPDAIARVNAERI